MELWERGAGFCGSDEQSGGDVEERRLWGDGDGGAD